MTQRKNNPPRIAKLVPPHMDKHWSFQIQNRLPDDSDKARSAMYSNDIVKQANPFLQGCSDDWLMIEFWTLSKEAIDAACKQLSETFGLAYTEGQFTREDVFGPDAD